MDAIRKKMQSLKGETDVLYATIARFEGVTKDANSQSDTHEIDIRDLGKKITGYESDFDETNDKLIKALTALEEKEKAFKNAEEEVIQFFKLKVCVFQLAYDFFYFELATNFSCLNSIWKSILSSKKTLSMYQNSNVGPMLISWHKCSTLSALGI